MTHHRPVEQRRTPAAVDGGHEAGHVDRRRQPASARRPDRLAAAAEILEIVRAIAMGFAGSVARADLLQLHVGDAERTQNLLADVELERLARHAFANAAA